MSRPRAETMPAVTVEPSPNGLPIAIIQSPTRTWSLFAHSTNGNGAGRSILSSARSVLLSVPINLAGYSLSSLKMTVISSASAITWLLVTTKPEASMTKPEPSEKLRRGCCSCCCLSRSKNSLKNSSNGEPGGNCGMAGMSA